MLVGAGHHEHVVPGHPHVAAEHVGGDAEAGDVADVPGAVGVRPGHRGEHVGHGRSLGSARGRRLVAETVDPVGAFLSRPRGRGCPLLACSCVLAAVALRPGGPPGRVRPAGRGRAAAGLHRCRLALTLPPATADGRRGGRGLRRAVKSARARWGRGGEELANLAAARAGRRPARAAAARRGPRSLAAARAGRRASRWPSRPSQLLAAGARAASATSTDVCSTWPGSSPGCSSGSAGRGPPGRRLRPGRPAPGRRPTASRGT